MTLLQNKLFILIVLLIHGIGHFQGVFAALGLHVSDSWHGQSWLFSKVLSHRETLIACMICYGMAGVMTLVTALSFYGILLPQSIWITTGVVSIILSIICLMFFWNGLAFLPNKIGAILVNAFLTWLILEQ